MGLASTLNKLNKVGTLEDELLKVLDIYYKRVGVARAGSATFKPSKIHGCKRSLYYTLVREETDGMTSVNPEMTRIGRSGSADHLVIQADLFNPIMKELGIEMLDPEYVVERAAELGSVNKITRRPDSSNPYELLCRNETYNMSFMFDGAFRFMGKLAIFEFKTEDHFKFIRRTSAEPAHILQATCYSLCLGIDEVLFLYQNRNYKSFKAYLVRISEESKQEIKDIMAEVMDSVDRRQVPPKDKGPKSKNCRYCYYHGVCKRDGE